MNVERRLTLIYTPLKFGWQATAGRGREGAPHEEA
jgi:hypothetical protein